jgi:voltage-gated potassium channel
LFKVGRYSRAMALLVSVLRKRSSQLGVFLFLSAILAFITATGIYYAENTAQPEVFSSIPASLWWSVVTLTTVGYGDAYPITVAGKFFTAIIIILSLGVVALPTGIVSAGLVEALKNGTTEGICPTCGRPIDPNSGQDPDHQGVPVSEETPSRPAGTPSISV